MGHLDCSAGVGFEVDTVAPDLELCQVAMQGWSSNFNRWVRVAVDGNVEHFGGYGSRFNGMVRKQEEGNQQFKGLTGYLEVALFIWEGRRIRKL